MLEGILDAWLAGNLLRSCIEPTFSI